jgi:hypothetical protein
MAKEIIKLPLPQSGGLLLSYKCMAKCRHCIYFCSPEWPADWISEKDLNQCLSLLSGKINGAPWGPHSVSLNQGLHFTGGEPFLNYDLLLRATEIANQNSIPSTFVETNCFWCIDEDSTRGKLLELKKAGLKGIMISVNPFYAEYIPFKRTELAIKISEEVFGNNVMIYQWEYYRQFKALGIKEKISLKDYITLTENRNFTGQVEMFLMGRAINTLKKHYPHYSSQQLFRQPCITPVLRNWHNHFDNYGNIMAGFCGGISLGSWRDIDMLVLEGIDLRDKPVLKYLISEDIEGMYNFAKNKGFVENEAGFISKCDLCFNIRKFLFNRGLFKELSPAEFYLNSE